MPAWRQHLRDERARKLESIALLSYNAYAITGRTSDDMRVLNDINGSVTFAMENGLEFTVWGRDLLNDRTIPQIFVSRGPARLDFGLSQPATNPWRGGKIAVLTGGRGT